MNVFSALALSFLSLSSTHIVLSQPKGVTITKKANWVESIGFDPTAQPKDRQGSSYYYLLTDEQENTATQEAYGHFVYRILTIEGVQNMSDLSIVFEPSYQQLFLHEIRIIRDGNPINQLTNDIQLIQREQSMESKLYDGTKTAIINLRDIRIGDIVEYAYTIKGYNPVFRGHIARTISTDAYESIDKTFKKFILSASKNLNVKSLGTEVQQPVVKDSAGLVHYTWSKSKVTAREWDYGTPSWYERDNLVMITDFNSWRDVGNWAKELFALPPQELQKIKNELAPTFTADSDEDYILKVVHFVQDEIRYLGFELGENSHKPYPPTQIYQQRFGDCKDKALLLVTLLQSRDIEAYPVLVNTSLKQSIDSRLPSTNLFDHCVVQLTFDEKKIYIDPTINNQGGNLSNYYFPAYRRGLVIDSDIAELDVLPDPESPGTSEIHTLDLAAIGGEAMMEVRTLYTGSDADIQRSYFAQNSLEAIQKTFKDYYANLYPDIVVWDDIEFTDNRSSNTFIVEEKYKIPTFWNPLPGKENQIYAQIQPLALTNLFDVPKNIQQRKSPYYLSYPVEYNHTIHVNLPEEFNVAGVDNVIENDLYLYEYSVSNRGKSVTKSTHYKTKADQVPADRIGQYVADHTRMYSELVFQFTYDRGVTEAAKNTLPGIITTIVALAAGAFLAVSLYHHYDPEPNRYMVRGLPIGGWLILLAVGISISPLRLLVDLFKDPEIINGAGWMSFLALKNYPLFAFVFVSHIFNIVKLLFLALLIVLFFQRRTSFPRLMTIMLATQLVMVAIDTIAGRALANDSTSISMNNMIQSIVAAAIWIPYLNMSQRVKDTFVIRGRNHEDDDIDEAGSAPALASQERDRSDCSEL